jgi:hypothetical protein
MRQPEGVHLRPDHERNFDGGHRLHAAEQRSGTANERFERAHGNAMDVLRSQLVGWTENPKSLEMGPADIVVAVPVRNEIDRIGACTGALSHQQAPSAAARIRTVFLVNDSTDGTAEWLVDQLPVFPRAAAVIHVDMPHAERNAGRARWLANHVAMDMVDPVRGQLFMTDADSCVPGDWVQRYSHMLQHGWDAIAGPVAINRDDCQQIVASLDHRNHLEGCYTALIDELESLIDPVAHDPWPRHFNAFGANLAVKVAAVRRLDDLPSMACGEDRALVRAMEALDMKIRHDTLTAARTSGRLFGRAEGGMADTLRHRTHVPDASCDERLEHADRACLRASLRATWRQLHPRRNTARTLMEQFAVDLGVSFHIVASAAGLGTFGASWHALEAVSPRLVRRPIAPSHLTLEIRRARDLIRIVRRGVMPAWREPDLEISA